MSNREGDEGHCPLCRRGLERTGIVVPHWVLPLQRLMAGSARGDLARAWAELPRHLAPGRVMPSVDEAAIVLLMLGLA